jgi:type I restriction enzyme S subunit
MSRYKAYPEYKDSGCDWFDSLPTKWDVKRISHIAQLQSGDAIVSDQIEAEGSYAVYGGNGLRGYSSNFNLEGDYILIGRQGALCGNINYGSGKFWASEHAVVVYPFFDVAIKWLGETLRAMNLNQYNVSAAQPGLAVTNITCLKIPFPSRDEQEKIAQFLYHKTAKIDALIEKQQRLIELLKEKRQAVISHAVTKGLNPNAPMKYTGVEWLGEVPAHWGVLPIKYISESIGTGGTPKSELSFTEEPEINWFTPGDFSNHAKLICSNKHITNRAVANGDAKVFQGNSILVIGIGATLGKVALCESNFSCNQQINVVSPNSKAKAEFLVNSLQAQTEQMKQSSNFSTIGIMNQEKTKQLVVAVPPLDEQVAVATFLDEKKMKFDAIESQAVNQIALLQERRTALISAAVTGKIDVREWQSTTVLG